MRFLSTLGLLALLTACGGSDTNVAPTDGEEEGDVLVDDDGDGYTADEDCDDLDDTVNPGAVEVCNGLDDDCDEVVDDVDADQDGAIDAACEGGTDCNDADGLINPAAEEQVYDGVDNDCDPTTVDDDLDGDGFSFGADCDDGDPDVNPGATEQCNGLDDDCTGGIDNGLDRDWYPDIDEDTYGADTDPQVQCDAPTGYVARAGDCDDADPAVNPDALELVNGLDDDCDGTADVGALLPDGTAFAGYTCGNGDSISDATGMAWVAGVVGNDPTGSGSTFWVDQCGYLGEAQSYGFWIPEGTSLDVARTVDSPAFIGVLTGDLCAYEVGDGLEHFWHNPAGCSG